MQAIPIDKLLNRTHSIYKLVTLAALRAIELSEGAAKLVDIAPDAKVSAIVLQEILEGKISYKTKGEK